MDEHKRPSGENNIISANDCGITVKKKSSATSKYIPLKKPHSEYGIVYRNDRMKKVISYYIKRVKQGGKVPIYAPPGSGKGVFAIAAGKILGLKKVIRVSMNNMNDNSLLDSYIGGHKKGAFSDAIDNVSGAFQLADKNVLHLDEVQDADLKTQSKLLDLFQERVVFCVGKSEKELINPDVIILTYNVFLEDLVEKGSMRSDFYSRIDCDPIVILPLNDRREDIFPLTCDYILKKESSIKRIHIDALKALEAYNYTYNVRTLQEKILDKVILDANEDIELEHIKKAVEINTDIEILRKGQKCRSMPIENYTLEEIKSGLIQKERSLLREEIVRCGGNISKISRNLKWTSKTVRKKIKRYSLV